MGAEPVCLCLRTMSTYQRLPRRNRRRIVSKRSCLVLSVASRNRRSDVSTSLLHVFVSSLLSFLSWPQSVSLATNDPSIPASTPQGCTVCPLWPNVPSSHGTGVVHASHHSRVRSVVAESLGCLSVVGCGLATTFCEAPSVHGAYCATVDFRSHGFFSR